MLSMQMHSSLVQVALFLVASSFLLTKKTEAFTTRILSSRRHSTPLLNMSTMMDSMSEAVSKSLGRTVHLEPASGGGFAGGGGASTSAVMDSETKHKYFVKSASGAHEMLKAEYLGVKEMADTHTIQVPTPVAFGDGPRICIGITNN